MKREIGNLDVWHWSNKLLWFKAIWIVFTFVGLAFTAEAAVVTKKRKKKKRYLIHVDAGTLNGFVKKTKVCFYRSNGKKAGCGKIVRAKEETSVVRVPKKRYKKIKKGMEARAETTGLEMAQGGSATGSAITSNFKALSVLPTALASFTAFLSGSTFS